MQLWILPEGFSMLCFHFYLFQAILNFLFDFFIDPLIVQGHALLFKNVFIYYSWLYGCALAMVGVWESALFFLLETGSVLSLLAAA